MTDDEAKQIVEAAAKVLLEAVTDVLDRDPHCWSYRPCDTCRLVSTIIGKPFGCIRKAQEQRKRLSERKR